MSCLNITNGLFINVGPDWHSGNQTVTTPGAVTIENTVGDGYPGLSVTSGNKSEFFPKPANGVIHFMTFGNPANFILVLTISDTTPGSSATRTVTLVNTSGSSIQTENLLTIQADNTVSLPEVQPSQGNGCVFMLMGSNGTDVWAAIFRSDNGTGLCSAVPFHPEGQVIGEATATELRIKEGGDIRASCPKPMGECLVENDLQFPDAVIGAGVDPSLSSSVRQATLRNDGNDCLTISNIGNVAPFSVIATSSSLPVVLDPGMELMVDVRFAPTVIANFEANLPISRSPANGDDVIHCEGEARSPILTLSFSGTIAFGDVRVGTSHMRSLEITNTGEASISIVLPSSPPGSEYVWSAFAGNLTPGNSTLIAITFTPTSEGPVNRMLSFTSTANGSPHGVMLFGEGCVPRALIDIDVPPGPAIDFGEVQRGFRMVRVVTVHNTGNGPLNFRAMASSSPAFGLQREGESITSPASSLTFTVNPTDACGALATGSGAVVFAVTFFADGPAGVVTGELVIDNHNAEGGAPPAFAFDLRATIIDTVNVDVELVLDRSGSMAEPSGERTKIATTIDAAKLFVQLGRADVDDRLGLVRFNSTPEVFSPIQPVTSTNQDTLVDAIDPTTLSPAGSTAVAGGVIEALRDFDANPRPSLPPQLNKAVVVLTDGMDNTPYTNPDDGVTYSLLGGNGTTALPVPAGVRVYAIGIGDNIDVGRLGQLAQATGGQFLYVHDFSGLDYFKLEKHFTQIYMDTVDLATIVDPTYMIPAFDKHVHEFDVLRGDVSIMVVIYDRDLIRLPFYLETPSHEVIELNTVPPGFQLRPGMTNTARFLEVRMPQGEESRYAGRWKVVIRHDGKACTSASVPGQEQKGMKFGFRPDRCRDDYNKPIMYGIAIGAGSNFRMMPFVQPGIVKVGEPIKLNALVSEFGLPVLGCTVTVESRGPDGATHTLTLRDDGIHQDDDANDGNYGILFTHTYVEGSYDFTFRAKGYSRDGEPVNREATRSKYVEGRVPLIPSDPDRSSDTNGACCTRIERWLRVVALALVLILLVLLYKSLH